MFWADATSHNPSERHTGRLAGVKWVNPDSGKCRYACVDPTARMIWLVDDDPLVRRLAEERGRSPHIHVVPFPGGHDMLEVLPDAEPFLLVIDNEMPKMSGIATGSAAREHGYSGPMVLWTASPNRDVLRRASESGFDRVFSKAISIEQILADVGFAA